MYILTQSYKDMQTSEHKFNNSLIKVKFTNSPDPNIS